jgi:F420-0:gamma-glutamyl ligase-like protein
MAASDFWQTLSDTIHRAVNLRVVTVVGGATITGKVENMEVTLPAAAIGSLVTDINLVGGDITRVVSDKLMGADYADLRNAHEVAVKQAQEIVERNVGILIQVAKELGEQLNLLPSPSPGPVRTASN